MKLGRVIYGFESNVHRVSRIVSWIGRATLGGIAFLLTTDVILRGVFDKVIIGTRGSELCRILLAHTRQEGTKWRRWKLKTGSET